MKEGLKWIITRWHFWVIVFVIFLLTIKSDSEILFLSEYLGVLIGSFLIVFIVYVLRKYLSYLIKKNKK